MVQSHDGVAFISTFPPRKCGIATFTDRLLSACAGYASRRLEFSVVAIDDPDKELDYPDIVRYRIEQRAKVDYMAAADFLNSTNVRVVSLQHEFGIFGGNDGEYVLDLIARLNCPVITTLHTVLNKPTASQRKVTEGLIKHSQKLIAMSKKGAGFLHDVYNSPRRKIQVIPHGVEQLPLVESGHYKKQFGLEGRTVLLTFGLLSPGKGIEYMLKALPPVVEAQPDVCYVILGATHPEIIRQKGEQYRIKLQRLTEELGLQGNVLFINRFVELEELCEYLKATDIYVTPYLNKEQIASGTLAYALGAGKPVVSTPYWHAEELLDKGRGMLVNFKDPDSLSKAILELLTDADKMREIRGRAYEYSRRMVWSEIGGEYINAFREAMSAARVRGATADLSMRKLCTITGLPRPKLDHLQSLTDDTGLFQHARYCVARRDDGYTTDDNARGLVVATKYYSLFGSREAIDLLNNYIAFVHYAQRPDGLFRNFMSYGREFLEEVGSDDCFGRALWGLGYVTFRGPSVLQQLATEMLERSMENHNLLKMLSPRARAHVIVGLYYYLQRYPEAHDIEDKIRSLADKNVELFEEHSEEGWDWFEPVVTYDNAVLPQAMFLAYEVVGAGKYLDLATRALDFLLQKCRREDHFSFVGNKGWQKKSGEGAQFDQQPIDACGMVEALKSAFRVTGEKEYLNDMRLAFDWFLGVNDIGEPLYDFGTGGCADGLTHAGVNLNQGAESTLSCLLSLLTLTEIHSEQARVFLPGHG